ncbi:hypothetical protein DAKH74_053320 [Maudiozyma humilis]|uniref:Uncharacterized protein n=1 Tax=Maudiozyma humilis TaxID=51915 RepID=A0AAV5S4V7_MAUHU|nr:hypothetical protein DAKH74_053320 [Kazachstania humilis]
MGSEFQKIDFNEKEMDTMFNNSTNIFSVSETIDTVFWCQILASSSAEEILLRLCSWMGHTLITILILYYQYQLTLIIELFLLNVCYIWEMKTAGI